MLTLAVEFREGSKNNGNKGARFSVRVTKSPVRQKTSLLRLLDNITRKQLVTLSLSKIVCLYWFLAVTDFSLKRRVSERLQHWRLWRTQWETKWKEKEWEFIPHLSDPVIQKPRGCWFQTNPLNQHVSVMFTPRKNSLPSPSLEDSFFPLSSSSSVSLFALQSASSPADGVDGGGAIEADLILAAELGRALLEKNEELAETLQQREKEVEVRR